MANDPNEPERPRVEPEIIPPDRVQQQSAWRSTWQPAWGARGTQRIYVTRIGPFGVALWLLAFALIAAVILFIIVGAVLLWIPVVAFVVIVAAVFRFLRR
jgi:hypothetical protein